MVIYIQNKFNEFIFICYLVMAKDENADGRTTQSLYDIPPPSSGGKKFSPCSVFFSQSNIDFTAFDRSGTK